MQNELQTNLGTAGNLSQTLLWNETGTYFSYKATNHPIEVLAAGHAPFLGERSAQRPAAQKFLKNLLFAVLALLIVGILAFGFYLARMLSRQILDPLATLRHAAKEIEQGNLDAALHVNTRDELGATCTAFDNMRAELKSARLERDYLEAIDFAVEIVTDGKEGLEKAHESTYDLLLLDIMLPNVDGFSICREVRKVRETPILMVSAKREDIDKIRALGLGADDYIIKPFSPSELVARVKAHIARFERLTKRTAPAIESLTFGDLEIQIEPHRVLVGGKDANLTKREFELLVFLAKNPNIVFRKDRLFDRVWGLDAVGDTATVMVHIQRIREKIEPDPGNPIYIETVWGAGYRFCGTNR